MRIALRLVLYIATSVVSSLSKTHTKQEKNFIKFLKNHDCKDGRSSENLYRNFFRPNFQKLCKIEDFKHFDDVNKTISQSYDRIQVKMDRLRECYEERFKNTLKNYNCDEKLPYVDTKKFELTANKFKSNIDKNIEN